MELLELIGQELFDKVKEKLNGHQVIVAGKDERFIKDDGNLISKKESNDIITQRLSEVTEQKRVLSESNNQLKEQLETLKTQNKGNEDLTQKLQTLQDQIGSKDKEIEEITKKSRLENNLILKANAKYPDLILPKIKLDEVQLADDDIKGFDELVAPIKEKYPELFGAKQNPDGDNGNNGVPGKITLTEEQKQEARARNLSDEDYADILERNAKLKTTNKMRW